MLNINYRIENFLSDKDLEEIHNRSIRLLEEVGIKIYSDRALRIFKNSSAEVNDNVVYLSNSLVEEMISKAPSSFILYSRNPKNNVLIGDDSSVLSPGFGAPFVIDINNEIRKSTFSDYIKFTKLSAEGEYFDVLGGVLVEPNDIPDKIRHLKMLHAGAKYSDKCLMGSGMGAKKAKDTIKLASIIFGENYIINDRPILITVISTNSPLQYDQRMVGSLIEYACCNQPLIISSAIMAGLTGPMSLAGTLILQNAEILAGIVLTQLINPGTPVIYGSASTITDMTTAGLAIGSPEYIKMVSATSQLANYYNLPSRAGGAVTDSINVDLQAGYESMMTFISTINCGTNFILHAAGILGSYMAMSYEKFIMDREIISMINNYQSGIEINKNTMCSNLIAEVSHGNNYLTEQHTLQNMKRFKIPELSVRNTCKSGGKSMPTIKRANKIFNKLLSEYKAPYLSTVIEKQIKKYIESI